MLEMYPIWVRPKLTNHLMASITMLIRQTLLKTCLVTINSPEIVVNFLLVVCRTVEKIRV